MKKLLLLLFFATTTLTASAQGELPVNMYTGSPGIFVKLYTLADHDLSETVSLSYNVNGINLNAPKTYGVGWNLDVGGQISREVRGLPDDFIGTGADTRKGWLYNNNYSSILNFPNSSDLSTSTCDEQTDNSFISNVGDKIDTEPDLFSFSVGGISGHFVFNNSGTISLIPYQDVLITPTYSTDSQTPKKITAWTIKTNAGITYSFNVACDATRALTKQSNASNVTILNHDYNQYNIDPYTIGLTVYPGLPVVSYASSWMLTTTSSFTGASLTYAYTSTPAASSEWKVFSVFNPGTPPSRTSFYLMMEKTTSTIKKVSSITTSFGAKAMFNNYDEIAFYDPDRSNSISFKKFTMGYSSGFLTSIAESDDSHCTQMPPYKFYYNAYGNYPLNGSTNQDFWGYYNGASNSYTSFTPTIYCYPNEPANERYRIYPIPSYAGTQVVLQGSGNRMPNTDAMLTGALTRIIYPTGGETDLAFEPNTYFDSKANKDQLGGGLRIKSAVYYDGVNPAANITKTFSYTDVLGHSSGKIINMPIFAVPLWQFVNTSTTISYSTLVSQGTNNQWSGITAVSQSDLNPTESTSGSSVGYARVTVTRPNSGKAVFDYFVPAAYGDAATGAGATDWKPTTMKFARPGACPSMNEISQAETWGYPAFANPYYDYERGLLNKKWEYNNANTLIRTTQQNYQYIYSSGTQPTSVVGLAYDLFANSSVLTYLYGRYSLIADVAKVVSTETVVTYDDSNIAQFSTEATQYNFNSPYHRLVSRIDKTASDGTVYRTSFKYTLDYPVNPVIVPTDITLAMIKNLKDANRFSTVIEQVNTVQPSGGVEKTTGASLIKFDPFATANPTKPLLRYQLAFRPDAPVTDFDPSVVDGNYAFHHDQRYKVVNTINEYDEKEMPMSSTDENGNTSATLWGHNYRLPVANFGQAQSTSVGFSNFETSGTALFAPTNVYYGQGRTGANGIHPYATLSRSVVKPAGASNYTLSFWLKNQANTSVTIRVILKDGNGVTLSTNDYPFALTGNDYQYFTKSIDVSAVPSNFAIQLQGVGFAQPSGSSSSLLPMLDDVGFYPDYVALSTTTYDIPFGANSVTDPSGVTMFTSYDGLGRAKLVIDQDQNIRKRISYAATDQILPTTITASVSSIIGTYETNTPIQFVATPLNCITGVTYEWDFGSGYVNSGTNVSPAQTYATTGIRTLTLRVSHATYGQKTTTFTYTINPPLNVTICPTGVKQMDAMTVTQTYSCFTNPNPANWATFKVTQDAGDASVWYYQWKEHRIGTNTWTTVPNNSSNTYGRQVLWREGSFEVTCTITTSDGRTADATPVLVTVNQ